MEKMVAQGTFVGLHPAWHVAQHPHHVCVHRDRPVPGGYGRALSRQSAERETADDGAGRGDFRFEAIKPPIIAAGFIAALGSFILLSFFGFPILLVFGYVRSLTQIPHLMITEIIGALLARFYFWKKYGRQQWRLYAAVLSVGFAVGMALVALAMIQKSVSVLIF